MADAVNLVPYHVLYTSSNIKRYWSLYNKIVEINFYYKKWCDDDHITCNILNAVGARLIASVNNCQTRSI